MGDEPGRINRGHAYRERLGPAAAGRRLLDYLASRYRHSTRLEWEARIASGQVSLDGRTVEAGRRLFRGQRLAWHRPPWREPAAPASFAILYRDDHLLAVAKPAGLPTLPGAGFLEGTLWFRVRAIEPRATPLHRLGRHTSGIVLFARSHRARVELSRQWAAREVGKRYRALAGGRADRRQFVVAQPIGPVPHTRLGTVHGATAAGKPALSEITLIEQRQDTFLCDVRIATGRPHQVRIHLAAAGHPLVGDPLYQRGGTPAKDAGSLPGDPGYRLHAAELTFRHPASGRALTLTCAPPPCLRPSASR